MKIFISYKFADEDQNKLEEFMKNIKASLQKSNHEMLTTFFYKEESQKNNASVRQIMDKALDYIDSSDIILCIVKSQEKSEGQIFEIGYSIAKKKKLILAIQKGLKTRWIEHYANKIIEFEDLNDLYKKLEKF
jgi:nucleoside 2-deoxyribosyltransferase